MKSDDVKQLRSELKCTTRELAQALGVAQSDILDWERGERFPTKRHVDHMSKLRDAGAAAFPKKNSRGTSTNPYEVMADPQLWSVIRKLCAHPELRKQVLALAKDFGDPGEE